MTAKTLFSVTFKWNELACHKRNGPITGYGYRIYYDYMHYIEGVLPPNKTTHTIYTANLGVGGYSLSIAAINPAGVGEFSPQYTVLYTELGNGLLTCSLSKIVKIFLSQ